MSNIILTTPEELKQIIVEVLNENKPEPPKPSQENELITRKETAKILGISLVTLNEWSKKGLIPSYKINTRIRYKKSEVLQALHEVKKYGRVE